MILENYIFSKLNFKSNFLCTVLLKYYFMLLHIVQYTSQINGLWKNNCNCISTSDLSPDQLVNDGKMILLNIAHTYV